MKKLLFGFLGLIVLLVAAAFILPNAVDWRPRIAAAVKSATGHELRIAGPLHVTLLPGLAVTASDLHLANAAAPGDFASAASISATLEWLPLLHGQMVFDTLVVQQPMLALAVDKDGKPNWLFPPAKPAKPTAPPAPSAGSAAQNLVLRQMRLDQGRFSYNDAVTGQTIAATDITLTGGTAGKVAWMLGMTLNNEPVAAQFTIDSTEKLLAGQPATIAMSLKGKHLTASYQGTAQNAPAPGLNGTFDLNIPSVGALFAWLNQPLAADPGPLTLHLETVSDGGKLTLRNAALTGKAIKLTAQASVDATKTPPSFEAKIDIPQADLDAYMPPAKPAPTAAPAAPAPSAPAPATAGWSTVPYDFRVLGGANGHLAISAAKLRYHGQDITDTALDLTLGKRVLRLTKGDLHVAGGSIAGSFTLDASAAAAKFQAQADIQGLQLRPALTAFAGSDRLAGRLAATADLTATGATQQQMIASLAGAGTLRITDGAIYGFDLAKSLHQIGSLRLANAPTDKTDFTSLAGTYTIKAGVLANNDLQLLSPAATVSGSGTVSLPPRSLDYTLQTRLAPGQGVAAALAAVAIPVQVTGPWSRPNVQADWSAALNQIKLPGDLGKVAPDINKVLPGIKLPKGLFR